MRWQSDVDAAPSQVLAEESARAFMGRVYRWMFGGLAVTGITALMVATNPELLQGVIGLRMPLIIAQLVLVMAFSYLAPRVSATTAALMFLGYAFLTGLTFSVFFLIYQLGSIFQAFFVAAGTFAALSAYGTVTKKDLSAWATFLFMGLVGIILASVMNIFVGSQGLSFVVSCAGVLVFAGLTAYDTQKLRQYHATSGYSSAGALAINGALILYLDFINLFLSLLRLFGRRR